MILRHEYRPRKQQTEIEAGSMGAHRATNESRDAAASVSNNACRRFVSAFVHYGVNNSKHVEA